MHTAELEPRYSIAKSELAALIQMMEESVQLARQSLLMELEEERMRPTRPPQNTEAIRKQRELVAVRERARFDARQREYRDKPLPPKKPCVSVTSLMRQVEKIEQLKAKLRRIA